MNGKKIVPGVVAGFVTAIGAWVAATWGGIDVPAEVAAAFTGLLAVVISVATPDEMEAE
jgi:hypothetical protein